MRSSLPASAKPPVATKPVFPVTKPAIAAKPAFLARALESKPDIKSVNSFCQVKLAGKAGNNTLPISTTPSTKSAPQSQPEEIMCSSLPGLKKVTTNCGSNVTSDEYKWNPWQPVSTTNSTAAKTQNIPHSSLQSTVYTKDKDSAPESILAYMGDITYPPLQK